jgi:sporulation protein YlmC with PRC-barrel domain
MSELLHLMAGSEVRCTDGRVGHVGGLIFDPEAGTVTHVSVKTRSATQNGRLVPLADVQSAGEVTQLACARDDYYKFPENEEFVMPVGSPQGAAVLHVHLVPHGQTELNEDETIHAVDGRAGHLVGVAVDRQSHAVKDLLVRVGHFSGRHQLSVPFDAVTAIEKNGIHLRMSKDELSAQSELT